MGPTAPGAGCNTGLADSASCPVLLRASRNNSQTIERALKFQCFCCRRCHPGFNFFFSRENYRHRLGMDKRRPVNGLPSPCVTPWSVNAAASSVQLAPSSKCSRRMMDSVQRAIAFQDAGAAHRPGWRMSDDADAHDDVADAHAEYCQWLRGAHRAPVADADYEEPQRPRSLRDAKAEAEKAYQERSPWLRDAHKNQAGPALFTRPSSSATERTAVWIPLRGEGGSEKVRRAGLVPG